MHIFSNIFKLRLEKFQFLQIYEAKKGLQKFFEHSAKFEGFFEHFWKNWDFF